MFIFLQAKWECALNWFPELSGYFSFLKHFKYAYFHLMIILGILLNILLNVYTGSRQEHSLEQKL